jgi:hypothetical protein
MIAAGGANDEPLFNSPLEYSHTLSFGPESALHWMKKR